MNSMRILHCITSLHPDGAQHALLRLLRGLRPPGFTSLVLSLTDTLTLAPRINELGISVSSLATNRSRGLLKAGPRLCSIVREFRPDVVQGWMYHGNLLATLAGRMSPGQPTVLWNIRTSVAAPSETKVATRAVRRLNAILSAVPNCVIYCAETSRAQHAAIGFHPMHEEVVPNGFELSRFKPDESARERLRINLGARPETVLVGNVARFHPAKDHGTLLRAVSILQNIHPEVEYVFAGPSIDVGNPILASLRAALPYPQRVHLIGPRSDIASILPAFDVYCSSSALEGFPNVIAEAMSCGVPCVATDVGASSEIIADTGSVVAPRSGAALAAAVSKILALTAEDRRALGMRARARIEQSYSIDSMVDCYKNLYAAFSAL